MIFQRRYIVTELWKSIDQPLPSYYNTSILMRELHLKYHSSETQQLGTMVIPAVECFYGMRKRVTGSPYQHLLFPAYSSTDCRPGRKKAEQKSPQLPNQLTGKTCQRVQNQALLSLLYSVQWTGRKEAQKAALKNFCFPSSPHYAVHSSDTARSWAKMFGVAISYSIG